VEFNLLYHMCQKPNDWQTTRDLLADVWRYPGNVGDAALVRNHIRNLRRKIEPDTDRPTIILSRHRRGYMVAARVEVVE
jgi:DNA-binding response OmpR family regulator